MGQRSPARAASQKDDVRGGHLEGQALEALTVDDLGVGPALQPAPDGELRPYGRLGGLAGLLAPGDDGYVVAAPVAARYRQDEVAYLPAQKWSAPGGCPRRSCC